MDRVADRRTRTAGGTGRRVGRRAGDLHPFAVGPILARPGDHHRSRDRHPLPGHRCRPGRDRPRRRRAGQSAAVSRSPGRSSNADGRRSCSSTSRSSRSASGWVRSSGSATTTHRCARWSARSGLRLGVTGTGGTLLAGALDGHRSAGRSASGRPEGSRVSRSAVPVGLATSVVVERLRRRENAPDMPPIRPLRVRCAGLAAGMGIVLALSGVAAAEGWVARLLGSVSGRVLPGSEMFWRLASHGALVSGRRSRHPGRLGPGDARHRSGDDEVRRGDRRVGRGSVDEPDDQRRPGQPRAVGHHGPGGPPTRHRLCPTEAAHRPARRDQGTSPTRPVDQHRDAARNRERARSRSSSGWTPRRHPRRGSTWRWPSSTARMPGHARCCC